jgi:gas vesicle protein
MEKTTQKEKGGGKLLEGALLGAVLGVVAGILLAKETEGKAPVDIKKLSGDFYRYIAPKIKRLKEISEEQYNIFIAQSVENFVKIKKLSLTEEKILTAEAKRSWKRIKKQLASK